MEYQRKEVRAAIRTQAKVIVEGTSHHCRIMNISVGGAKLQTARFIGQGSAVSLQIGEFGAYSATVAGQRSGELGVNFTHDASEMEGVIMGLACYG